MIPKRVGATPCVLQDKLLNQNGHDGADRGLSGRTDAASSTCRIDGGERTSAATGAVARPSSITGDEMLDHMLSVARRALDDAKHLPHLRSMLYARARDIYLAVCEVAFEARSVTLPPFSEWAANV